MWSMQQFTFSIQCHALVQSRFCCEHLILIPAIIPTHFDALFRHVRSAATLVLDVQVTLGIIPPFFHTHGPEATNECISERTGIFEPRPNLYKHLLKLRPSCPTI